MAETMMMHRSAAYDAQMPKFRFYNDKGDIPEGVGYVKINDGKKGAKQQWRIKFLTSGTLEFANGWDVDLFCVGGGSSFGAGGGGGGGYTKSYANIQVKAGTPYAVVVGGGGSGKGSSTGMPGGETWCIDRSLYYAEGGYYGNARTGGDGGSGGGGGGGINDSNASYMYAWRMGKGGSNGGAGGQGAGDNIAYHSPGWGGAGQRSKPGPRGETGSTREFYELDRNEDADLYGGGGSGAQWDVTSSCDDVGTYYIGGAGGGGNGSYRGSPTGHYGTNGTNGLGGGGGGGNIGDAGGDGGSGVIIFRNHR